MIIHAKVFFLISLFNCNCSNNDIFILYIFKSDLKLDYSKVYSNEISQNDNWQTFMKSIISGLKSANKREYQWSNSDIIRSYHTVQEAIDCKSSQIKPYA